MLKFHAKPGGCTPWPNSHVGGQTRRFIGRTYVAETRQYPASSEPDQVTESDADAPHMMRKCTRGEIWAADEATAKACGVDFVPLERGADGEWFPKKSPEKAPAKGSAPKE